MHGLTAIPYAFWKLCIHAVSLRFIWRAACITYRRKLFFIIRLKCLLLSAFICFVTCSLWFFFVWVSIIRKYFFFINFNKESQQIDIFCCFSFVSNRAHVLDKGNVLVWQELDWLCHYRKYSIAQMKFNLIHRFQTEELLPINVFTLICMATELFLIKFFVFFKILIDVELLSAIGR